MTRTLWVGCQTDETGTDGLIRAVTSGPDVVEQTGSWQFETPGWLTSADGIVYATQHTQNSPVAALRLTERGPQVLSHVATEGVDGCHAALDPTGELLAVAHYTSGSVALLSTTDQGELQLLDVLELQGSSGVVPDRQEAPHAHHIEWLSDEQLLVCDLGADLVRRLQVVERHLVEDPGIRMPEGFGPRHLVSRRLGNDLLLAVAGELTGQVAVVRLDDEGHDALVGLFDGSAGADAQPSGIRLDHRNRLWVGQRRVNTLAHMDWEPNGLVGPFTELPLGGEGVRDLLVERATAGAGTSGTRVWTALKQGNRVQSFTETAEGLVPGRALEVTSPMALLWQDEVHRD
ncbi:lactonase family protein [Propionibacteriaceae bacterium G57]|uniref:lactonase family protein n=1 Tax=Aestuariimicrobium sp. G57 TaxID=3418485 RepID=UPI003DA7A091